MYTSKAKLKPIATFVLSVKTVFRMKGFVAKASIIPIAIVAFGIMTIPYEVLITGSDALIHKEWYSQLFIWPLAIALIAVPIHRAILLGDTRPPVFRLGEAEVGYAGVVAFCIFIEMARDYVFENPDDVGLLSSLVTIGIFVFLTFYVSIGLPAVAIKEKKPGLLGAWRYLRGNWWRFFLYLIVVHIAFAITFVAVLFANNFASDVAWPDPLNNETMALLLQFTPEAAVFFISYLAQSLFQSTVIVIYLATYAAGLSLIYSGLRKKAAGAQSTSQTPTKTAGSQS